MTLNYTDTKSCISTYSLILIYLLNFDYFYRFGIVLFQTLDLPLPPWNKHSRLKDFVQIVKMSLDVMCLVLHSKLDNFPFCLKYLLLAFKYIFNSTHTHASTHTHTQTHIHQQEHPKFLPKRIANDTYTCISVNMGCMKKKQCLFLKLT